MQQGVGLFLIINSLINSWYIIRLRAETKKAEKARTERIIDAIIKRTAAGNSRRPFLYKTNHSR